MPHRIPASPAHAWLRCLRVFASRGMRRDAGDVFARTARTPHPARARLRHLRVFASRGMRRDAGDV
jgi:hypothetical protein